MSTDSIWSEPPATILAISASGPWCSVALLRRDSEALDVIEEPVGHAHSQRALAMVDALLASCTTPQSALRGVAFDAGPGGFTGLRIACALAQGFGFGLGIPVLAVGSLDALALGALPAPGLQEAERVVIAATDARMSECYVAAYRARPGPQTWRLEVLEAPRICPAAGAGDWIAAVAARSADAAVLVAGDACARHPEVAEAARGAGAQVIPGSRPGAGAVALLAATAQRLSDWRPAAQARPVYVRDKVALDVDEQRALRRRNAEGRA